MPPALGHAAASPSLLPWRAGEGTGRLRGFGGRSRSWERFSHDCPGRGEHVRLRHEASPSLVSTSRPPPCQRAGNPFDRCQHSQEPWQCQPSCFPPRPANQGFLPPLSTQPFVPCTSITTSREVLTHCPVQGPPGQSLPQHLPASSTKGSLLLPSWQMPGCATSSSPVLIPAPTRGPRFAACLGKVSAPQQSPVPQEVWQRAMVAPLLCDQ